MHGSEKRLYKKGDAIKQVQSFGTIPNGEDGFSLVRKVLGDSDAAQFNDFKYYHLWAGVLVQSGRNIDDFLDSVLIESLGYGDSFYNTKRPIDKLIQLLLDCRQPIRDFEIDVQEFVNGITLTDINQSINKIASVTQILGDIHATYDRAFDICTLKKRGIIQGRVTATNIVLSVVAAAIAITSLLATKQ